MRKKMLWLQIGLVLGFLFVQACSKSVVDENILPVTQIKLNAIGNLSLKSITYQENEYKMERGRYLIPYEAGKDSIKIKLNFNNAKLSGWHQIPNHKREINQVYYLSDFADSTLTVSDKHPLDDFITEKGYMYVKFFGQNTVLFPDKKPFHLAVYGIIEEKSRPWVHVEYTEKPLDTIFNISNKPPKEFFKIKHYEKYVAIKLKLLNNQKEELKIKGRNSQDLFRAYYFLEKTSRRHIYTIRLEPDKLSPFSKEDYNTWNNNNDGGFTINNFFSVMESF